MSRFRGRVIWFCTTKGFGFIQREGAPDVFLHRGAVLGGYEDLHDGSEIEFEVSGPQGLQAENAFLV